MTPVSFPSLWTVQRLSEPPDSPPDSQPSRAWIQAGPDPRRRRSGSERARARRASPRRRREASVGPNLATTPPPSPSVAREREVSLSLASGRRRGDLREASSPPPVPARRGESFGSETGAPAARQARPRLFRASRLPRGLPAWECQSGLSPVDSRDSGLQRLWTPETLDSRDSGGSRSASPVAIRHPSPHQS